MNAYLFNAALLCPECARGPLATETPNEDSDWYPKGPYSDGGGEADYPCHCDTCGMFLENPLTADGREYVRASFESKPNHPTVMAWAQFYDLG